MDHAVNSIVLTVINDGDGSICGASYAKRCALADFGLADYRSMARHVDRWLQRHHDAPPAPRSALIAAASEVQEYYRNHAAERGRKG